MPTEESYCLPLGVWPLATPGVNSSPCRSCRRYQARTRVSWMEFCELLPTFQN
jgi:hypothetical protein